MKRMVSLLFVGIFVLGVLGAGVKGSRNIQQVYSTSYLDDEVPEWHVGDSWTYTIDSIIIDYNQGGQKIFMEGSIADFNWKVSDTSGDYYTVAVSGKLTVTYDILLSSQTKTLHLVGEFKPLMTRLTGTLQFTKSDLDLNDVSIQLKGITKAKINSLPFAFPIPFKLVAEGDLNVDLPLFDFPLHGLKFWNLPDLTITMISTFGGLFGIIQIPFTVGVHYYWTPFAFMCSDKSDITVQAGTFSAYKISSLIGEYFEYYYASSEGNIVKVDAVLPNGEVHGQLKSTNYP